MSESFSNKVIESIPVLPLGWIWTNFEEIGFVNPRSIERDLSDDSDVSFVPMRCVNEMGGGMDISIVRKYIDVKKGYTPFIDGDLLIAKITPCMENGKVVIADKLKNGIGFGSTEFHTIRFQKDIAKKLYYYYFLREDIRKDARSHMTGTAGQLRVPSSFIQNKNIPLPPLPEQHRIVTKIEELFTQLDAGIASLKQVQAQLKRYRQAVLKAAFEGRLTQEWREQHEGEIKPVDVLVARIPFEKNDLKLSWLAEGWIWTSVVNIGEVIGGLTKNQKRSQYPLKMPYLRVANVYSNRLDLSDVTEIGVLESELNRLLLKKGDLLVVEGNGSVDQIGRVAIWNEQISPCIHQNHIIKIRLTSSVSEKFLMYWLLSSEGRQEITNVASSTSGLYTLSISKVERLNLPLAPLLEQQTIVNEIERHFSQIDHLELTITTSLRQAETLRQSILKRAFEGKLVPQDPNDEPAPMLLERIKAEKTCHAAETKKSKTLQPKSPKRRLQNAN